MRTRRLVGIAALGAAAASILVIPGVGAQDPTYVASSDGRALVLTAFDEGLTAGLTHSEVSSDPAALATGAGILTPVAPVGASGAAAGTPLPEGAEATEGEQCGGELPEGLTAIGLAADFACSTSSASIAGTLPSSAADSRVGSLVVNPIGAINQTPLSAVTEGLEGGLQQLEDGLAPVFQGIDGGTGLETEDTVGDLIDYLLKGAPLATVTVGDTESTTTTTDTQVVTQCVAQGARIDILDPAAAEIEGVEVDAPPVLSVIVGDASTSVTLDRAAATAEAAASPAIATVIAPVLGEENQEINIGPGESQVIPLPDPFGNVVISVAGTIEDDTEDGGKSIQASAVRIHVFEGSEELMNGIELALADCTSVAGATATPAEPVAPAAPAVPPILPRTGSEGPNGLAIAAVIGFAGLGLTLLRRSARD